MALAGRAPAAHLLGDHGAAVSSAPLVRVPTHLQSYTAGRSEVPGVVGTLGDVLADLDARFPGLRFRIIDEQGAIRTHIKFFVAGELARDLAHPVGATDEVMIVAALSGGG